jgi:hypothetical protein
MYFGFFVWKGGIMSKELETIKPASTAENFSSADLTQRTLGDRAIEAVIWAMPAVNPLRSLFRGRLLHARKW